MPKGARRLHFKSKRHKRRRERMILHCKVRYLKEVPTAQDRESIHAVKRNMRLQPSAVVEMGIAREPYRVAVDFDNLTHGDTSGRRM